MRHAADQVLECLEAGEVIEAVVLGEWYGERSTNEEVAHSV